MKERNAGYDAYFDSSIKTMKDGARVAGTFVKKAYEESEELRQVLRYIWWENIRKLKGED